MKKFWMTAIFVVTLIVLCASSALAVTNDTVKVGIKYGSGALFSANLENATGSGYAFGYYDGSRNFVSLGSTAQTAISMTAAGTAYMSDSGAYGSSSSSGGTVVGGYHIQLDQSYGSFDEAQTAAAAYSDGYPAYISDTFFVRVGCYGSSAEAASALETLGAPGSVVNPSKTGVIVTVTKSSTVLFEFDCQGAKSLGVQPNGQGNKAATWFKGYKYNGGFEYNRVTGGNINVVNVVGLEDYVKGVVPFEMSGSWPVSALEAQAVCARTYVCKTTKHQSSYGFDVCNTTDCQVYYGVGSGSSAPTSNSNSAVDATAGQCLYYNGALIEAVYFSSDGGATEDAANVWGNSVKYLIGKQDPYESTISIPSYTYTVTYTPAQLTYILKNSGYAIGNVQNVYVSENTDMGNVYKVTFVDTAGKSVTVKGEKSKTVFYSSTYNKSVRSMRFKISGGSGDTTGGETGGSGSSYYVNNSSTKLDSMQGAYVISGSGTVSAYSGSTPYVVTSSGTAALSGGGTASGATTASSSLFTITGTGSGHNVGMSQYGAYAMAKKGMSYQDILNFYYTNVTIG